MRLVFDYRVHHVILHAEGATAVLYQDLDAGDAPLPEWAPKSMELLHPVDANVIPNVGRRFVLIVTDDLPYVSP